MLQNASCCLCMINLVYILYIFLFHIMQKTAVSSLSLHAFSMCSMISVNINRAACITGQPVWDSSLAIPDAFPKPQEERTLELAFRMLDRMPGFSCCGVMHR